MSDGYKKRKWKFDLRSYSIGISFMVIALPIAEHFLDPIIARVFP